MTNVIIFLLIVALLGLGIYHYHFRKNVKKEVENLLDFMTTVQNRNVVPELDEQAEGSFRILQSELYKLATLLQQQYSLEASHNRELSDFLSDISHQIKTPLAAILMMTHLLEDMQLSQAEREDYIHSIKSQVDRMTWLVKTLLVTARLDAGVLVLKRDEVDVEPLLLQVVRTHSLMAEAKGLDLVLTCPGDLRVKGDLRWLYEALSNIVKNCLEHTQTGQVTIRGEGTNLSTDIWIEDSGQGIAPADLPRIFERFYKGSHSDKQSVGIGLSLAQDIIKRQNGIISVTSQEGVGTKFHLRFYHRATL